MVDPAPNIPLSIGAGTFIPPVDETSQFGGVPIVDTAAQSRFGGIPVEGVEEPGKLGVVSGATQAINRTIAAFPAALASIVSLPIDLVGGAINLGLKSVGLTPASQFVGGTAFLEENVTQPINQVFDAIGVTQDVTFEELSRPAKIAFRGAELATGAVLFGALPLAAVRAGVVGPKFLAPILDFARQSPLRFSLLEATSAVSAGQGAAFAEAAKPGDAFTSFVLSITGGLINPTGAAVRAIKGGGGQLTKLMASFGRSRQEAKAAQIIRDIAEEAGEDLPALIRLLEEPSELILTAGRKTGSPTLLAIEGRLAQQSAKFSEIRKETTQKAFAQLRETIDKLVVSGDPVALRVAARLRQQYFDDVLTQRLQIAQQKAGEAATKIGGNKRASSARAFEALDGAEKEARAAERSIWNKVAKDIESPVDNLARKKVEMEGRLLEEESLPLATSINRILRTVEPPDIIGDLTILRAGRPPKPVLSGELIILRSRLLDKARELRAAGKRSEASIAGELADSVLDDVTTIPEFDEARAFSKSLNDVFTRGFGGTALAKTAQGAQRVSPELMLDRAFGKGGDVRFRELQQAADFSAGVFGGVMRNEQEAFVRAMANIVLDNGVVNPTKLRNFVRANDELLDNFPILRKELSDAGSAQQLVNETISANRVASRAIKERTVFARLINVENPTAVVGRSLRGPTQQRDYRQFAKVAKKSGTAAVEGLKTATLEDTMNVASRGGFTFTKLQKALFAPTGRFSVMETMQKNNVISVTEKQTWERIVNRGAEIEASVADTTQIEPLIDDVSALFDIMVRMGSVRLAALSPLSTPGPGQIVVAGAASQAGRRFFEKVPATKIMDVLIEAARNPPFAAAILKKPQSLKQRKALERQINGFLLEAGIIDRSEE